ncbi:very short patch repair endonuclease [Hyphomonas pacifica]|uniref:Very short patch repair endonuclease n=2 Tax=Hyphomonas pacifica TaxID=1280941 RepID=A0A8B2PVZ3_9PROT|nr:DNA glycosylase [Hyphomonas pacifica]
MSDEITELKEEIDPVRSKIMASVAQRGTKPEMFVRRLCHALGYRYRLHVKALPGSPDLVFPCRKKVIFVHGCFWHRHPGCSRTTTPKTRTPFWKAKFDENVRRDARQLTELTTLGWESCIVWECETRNPIILRQKLSDYLEMSGPVHE